MEAVVKILLWILGLQAIGAIGVGYIVSSRLFKPFRETLEKIKHFKLQDKEPIDAVDTKVQEFDELNRFVEEMDLRINAEYMRPIGESGKLKPAYAAIPNGWTIPSA